MMERGNATLPKPKRNTRGKVKGTSDYKSKTRKKKGELARKRQKLVKAIKKRKKCGIPDIDCQTCPIPPEDCPKNKLQKSRPKFSTISVNQLFQMGFPEKFLKLFAKRFSPPDPAPAREFVLWLASEEGIFGVQRKLQLIWCWKFTLHITGGDNQVMGSRNLKQIRRWLLRRCA